MQWVYQLNQARVPALRTWLYRIPTAACLHALQPCARRVLPAGLAAGSLDSDVSEPDNAERRQILDRFCALFHNASSCTELLQADVKLEMSLLAVCFTRRDALSRFRAGPGSRPGGRYGGGPDGRERAVGGRRVSPRRRRCHARPIDTRPYRWRQRDRGDHRLSESGMTQ
jgi:hypothetical protein